MNPNFDFNVDVTDNGAAIALAGVCRVLVNIEDQNDNSPQFPLTYYSFELAFNAPLNYFIHQMSANDADYGLNGQVQYSIYETNDDFAIDYTSGIAHFTFYTDIYKTASHMSK